jgi:uncharacterized membrane protein
VLGRFVEIILKFGILNLANLFGTLQYIGTFMFFFCYHIKTLNLKQTAIKQKLFELVLSYFMCV